MIIYELIFMKLYMLNKCMLPTYIAFQKVEDSSIRSSPFK